MSWIYYINPNRKGKGPWMWACNIEGNKIHRMNSLADSLAGQNGVSDLDVVVLTTPVHDQNPMSKVHEKTDNGYVYAFRVADVSDEQAVAIGTFLTIAARRIYFGISVNADDLWSEVEAHSSKEDVNEVWSGIPVGTMASVAEQTKEVCDRHINVASKSTTKGSFWLSVRVSLNAVPIDEIVRTFQFKEGTPSPIW